MWLLRNNVSEQPDQKAISVIMEISREPIETSLMGVGTQRSLVVKNGMVQKDSNQGNRRARGRTETDRERPR